MANTLVGSKTERLKKKLGILQIEVGPNTFQLVFTQRILTSINLDNFDRDFIDDQTPAFSQNGDIIGSATVDLKDTVDLYDTVTPATNVNTIPFWKEGIALGLPRSITFLETKQADQSAGDKFAREKWTGRIADVTNEEFVNQALYDATLDIEITSYVSGLRSAT